jgi:hypothetical protein
MYYADVWGREATDAKLEEWSADPDCSNAKECRDILERRAKTAAVETARRAKVREELKANPFDPRNEISADGRHVARQVVKHLWIIMVAMPITLGVLYGLLTTH